MVCSHADFGRNLDRSPSLTGATAVRIVKSARRLSESFGAAKETLSVDDDDHFSEDDTAWAVSPVARNGTSIDGPDSIVFSCWEQLDDGRLILIVVRRDIIQIWDAADLSQLRELATVANRDLQRELVCARLLQKPRQGTSSNIWGLANTPILVLAYVCRSSVLSADSA